VNNVFFHSSSFFSNRGINYKISSLVVNQILLLAFLCIGLPALAVPPQIFSAEFKRILCCYQAVGIRLLQLETSLNSAEEMLPGNGIRAYGLGLTYTAAQKMDSAIPFRALHTKHPRLCAKHGKAPGKTEGFCINGLSDYFISIILRVWLKFLVLRR
jgi:hypothetical protein